MTQQVLTASRLKDGTAVYLGKEEGWTENISAARLADSTEEADTLLEDGQKAVAAQIISDVPCLIPVTVEKTRIVPTKYLEYIRAFGPSCHPQFARKQG